MPHITIEMYPGRDHETKEQIAETMAEALSKAMNLDKNVVSVSIKEIPKENWKTEVYDNAIDDSNKEVFIKPGYSM